MNEKQHMSDTCKIHVRYMYQKKINLHIPAQVKESQHIYLYNTKISYFGIRKTEFYIYKRK